MKPLSTIYLLFLAFILLGCDDKSEVLYRYSQTITLSKDYPVYLDMTEISNIRVRARLSQTNPFKIVYNDKYCFVGDRLKGIHVYERKNGSISYLCFIECRHITDFEIVDNLLFCNNLVDLVVIDISDPPHISILHRQVNHFNQYSSYKQGWNFPYVEGKGLIADYVTHTLTGTITHQHPGLDFSDLDQLYGNLTTTLIPQSWFTEENDYRAVPAIIKTSTNEVYTYGTYNSWAICTYQEGTFSVREENLWTIPRGKYAPPNYFNIAYPIRMFFEDEIIYMLGALFYYPGGNSQCIFESQPEHNIVYELSFPTFKPIDICYMPQLNGFIALSDYSIWGAFISGNVVKGVNTTYVDYEIETGAMEIIRVGDKLLTLGDDLSIYNVSKKELVLVKKYPEISGMCCVQDGDFLTIANAQGLFIYDITDLENIQLIQ
jgi:hypothetical protein